MSKVMVIDKNSELRDKAVMMLKDSYGMIPATSVREAVNLMASSLPDAILINYELLELGGAKLMADLREPIMKKGVPIIFMSGSSERESVIKALNMKPDQLVLEPITRNKLVEAIEKTIHRGA